ncbi:MAG: hypothetical protein HRT47_08390 [Candidatus Caenarcaniphilales bacterium]|nr:hypothetical protein [Candidatus Caenarcaniphilales bacterium]
MVKNIMANQNGQTTLIQDNDNDIDKSVIELEERYYKDVNSQIQFESLPKNIGSFSLITQESNEPFLKQGRLSFYGKANKEPYISFKHKSGYLFNIGLLAWRDGNSKEKSNYINAQKAYLEASKEFQTNYKDPKVRDNYHQTEKLKRKSYTQFMDFFKNQTKLLNQDVITEGIVKLLNKLDLESHNVPNHILNKVTWNLAGEDYQSDELVAAADPSTDIVHIQCSKIDNFDIKLSKYKKIDNFKLADSEINDFNFPFYFAHELAHIAEKDINDHIPRFGNILKLEGGGLEKWIQTIDKMKKDADITKSRFMFAALDDFNYRKKNSDKPGINSNLTIGGSGYGEKSPHEAFAEILSLAWCVPKEFKHNFPNLYDYFLDEKLIETAA